jgi:NAD(P)-dependent dehydrogenase (short-subunit alcohol dehydrogenase family)
VHRGNRLVRAAEQLKRDEFYLKRYRSIFGPVYPASKTALNALTLAMAIELEKTAIKVNAVSPGFTRTNLNNYTGTETVEEGAREAVRVALLGPDGPTGTFTHATLGTLPW